MKIEKHGIRKTLSHRRSHLHRNRKTSNEMEKSIPRARISLIYYSTSVLNHICFRIHEGCTQISHKSFLSNVCTIVQLTETVDKTSEQNLLLPPHNSFVLMMQHRFLPHHFGIQYHLRLDNKIAAITDPCALNCKKNHLHNKRGCTQSCSRSEQPKKDYSTLLTI